MFILQLIAHGIVGEIGMSVKIATKTKIIHTIEHQTVSTMYQCITWTTQKTVSMDNLKTQTDKK